MVLAVAIFAGSILEVVSVGAVLPFVQIVMQPETIWASKYVGWFAPWIDLSDLALLVPKMGALVIGLMLCSACVNWAISYSLHHYAASCQTRLAKELLDRCLQASYSWFLSRNSAVLTRIFDDVSAWSRGCVQRVLMMVNSIGLMIMMLAALIVVSLGASLVVILVMVTVGGCVMALIRPQLARLATTKRIEVDTVSLTAHQALAGIKDIKLSSREGYFGSVFNRAYRQMTSDTARLNIWSESPSIVIQGLAQIALITIAIVLWNLGIEKEQLVTELTLIIIVTTKGIPTANSFSRAVNALTQAMPHVHMIVQVMASLEEEASAKVRIGESRQAIANWNVIRFDHVGYRYPGALEWALKDIECRFERGNAYGIVGPSAAGKSTMVDLLIGLLEPSSGCIMVEAQFLAASSLKDWQERIAYVPQMPFIIDDSLRANVAFGVQQDEVDDAWIGECLRFANLENLLEDLEHGLDTRLGERGVRLSGGQRQRIAIARAMYNRPEILVLDEATSTLDSLSESEILKALKNIRGQVTTVTIAHRLSTVVSCDEIFVLEAGRLVGRGSDAELRANHHLFRRMTESGV